MKNKIFFALVLVIAFVLVDIIIGELLPKDQSNSVSKEESAELVLGEGEPSAKSTAKSLAKKMLSFPKIGKISGSKKIKKISQAELTITCLGLLEDIKKARGQALKKSDLKKIAILKSDEQGKTMLSVLDDYMTCLAVENANLSFCDKSQEIFEVEQNPRDCYENATFLLALNLYRLKVKGDKKYSEAQKNYPAKLMKQISFYLQSIEAGVNKDCKPLADDELALDLCEIVERGVALSVNEDNNMDESLVVKALLSGDDQYIKRIEHKEPRILCQAVIGKVGACEELLDIVLKPLCYTL